jgi:hypothetical protein
MRWTWASAWDPWAMRPRRRRLSLEIHLRCLIFVLPWCEQNARSSSSRTGTVWDLMPPRYGQIAVPRCPAPCIPGRICHDPRISSATLSPVARSRLVGHVAIGPRCRSWFKASFSRQCPISGLFIHSSGIWSHHRRRARAKRFSGHAPRDDFGGPRAARLSRHDRAGQRAARR